MLALQRLVGNRAVGGLLVVQRQPEGPRGGAERQTTVHTRPAQRPALTSVKDARFERFRAAAGARGIGLAAAQHLWELSGGSGADAVTGFATSADADELRDLASRHGARHDSPSFNVTARVQNLGGLNAQLGHSGSDEVYRAIAAIVERELRGLAAEVHGYRIGGAEFGFVIVSKAPLSEAEREMGALRARMADAKAMVKGYISGAGLAQIPHPKQPQGSKVRGSGLEFEIGQLGAETRTPPRGGAEPGRTRLGPQVTPEDPPSREGPRPAGEEPVALDVRPLPANDPTTTGEHLDSADASLGGAVPVPPAPVAAFVGTADARRQRFAAAAAELGLDEIAAGELYAVTSGSETDVLTGFTSGADRLPTIARAAQFVLQHGAAAVYAEVDVKNLGGLNAELGTEKADAILARLAHLAEEALRSLDATVCAFRHGGDEVGFVVVGRPGSSPSQLEPAVRGRLELAQKTAQGDLAGYSHVRHPKHPERDDRAGTGIVYGTGVIGPMADPEHVVAVADGEVERRKLPVGVF